MCGCMPAHMYICVYVCMDTCTCMHVCIFVHLWMYVCAYVYVYMSASAYNNTWVHMFNSIVSCVCMNICAYVQMCMCVYVQICICIYVHVSMCICCICLVVIWWTKVKNSWFRGSWTCPHYFFGFMESGTQKLLVRYGAE